MLECWLKCLHTHMWLILNMWKHSNPHSGTLPQQLNKILSFIIKINDIKGTYKDDYMFKYIVLSPEPNESLLVGPITRLTSLLLQNDIFKYIHTAEELFYSKHPPLHAYLVLIKDEWLS